MRDFEDKINRGGVADNIKDDEYSAGEFNSLVKENENAVTRSGQVLADKFGTGEDVTQLGQSLFLHGVKSGSFLTAGTANVIELTPVSGAAGVQLPADYTNLSGSVFEFVPTANNTGNVTLSIGQTAGTQLGLKKLLNLDESELVAATIQTTNNIRVRYDAAADSAVGAWLLLPASIGAAGGQVDSVVGGTNIDVDNTDPENPIISTSIVSGGQVDSIVGGTNVSVDSADPVNPVITVSNIGVETIVAGTNISVDSADPANPIVSASPPQVTMQVIIATGTWTRPTGVVAAKFSVTGGGGAGADNTSPSQSEAGGGGGGTAERFVDVTSLPSIAVVVGAGGLHGVQGGGALDGGDSSIAGIVLITGEGGNGPSSDEIGGTGGIATGPTGSALYTGSDGAIQSSSFGGGGGASHVGGSTSGNSVAGKQYGGGGSGAPSTGSALGGDGAGGVIIVTEYR